MKKIKVYAGIALLTGTISLGIYDNNIDHSEHVCLITKTLNIVHNNGIDHQMKHMKKDLLDKGIDADIEYSPEYEEVEEYTVPSVFSLNEKIIYKAPDGYTLLRDENDKLVCKKVTTKINPNGNSIEASFGGYKKILSLK